MKGLLLLAAFSSLALAAPDEALLGKAEGYPACLPVLAQRCLVGSWSRMDELGPARKVAKGNASRPFKRAASEIDVQSFLDSNRNTGLLVLKDDTILVERYQYDRKPEHRLASASVAKTVVGMLVGIAISEGKIRSIDDLAARYVPELKGHPYGETSVRHLLTMSSGVKFTDTGDAKDDGATLARNTVQLYGPGGLSVVMPYKERVRPAGEKFSYSSAETQVLGFVLRAATGKPLAEYLSEKIWKPMGAEFDATWLVDPGGFEAAYCCLNAALRDYARFGLLLANYGALDGKEIIPAAWVKAATTPEAPHLQVGTATQYNGYGYQTWLTHRTEPRFAAFGASGQAIFIDAAQKLVVVHTAVHERMNETEGRRRQFELWGRLLSMQL